MLFLAEIENLMSQCLNMKFELFYYHLKAVTYIEKKLLLVTGVSAKLSITHQLLYSANYRCQFQVEEATQAVTGGTSSSSINVPVPSLKFMGSLGNGFRGGDSD